MVYELQVEEFNDTFDGVVDPLDYLQSLGINCLELMPVTSVKLDFDWGYGPLHYFAPNADLGGGEGLKRLEQLRYPVRVCRSLEIVLQFTCCALSPVEECARVRHQSARPGHSVSDPHWARGRKRSADDLYRAHDEISGREVLPVCLNDHLFCRCLYPRLPKIS